MATNWNYFCKVIFQQKVIVAFMFLTSIILMGCKKNSSTQNDQVVSSTTNTSGLKPLMSGFVSMGDISFHNTDAGLPNFTLLDITTRPGIFQGIVINATWSQLEPTQGQLNTHFLDSCLQVIRNYNSSNPKTTIAANLRIWPGPTAPAWAKQVGGSPISISSTIGQTGRTRSITIGCYWTSAYRSAWKSFLDRLGAIYDGEPLLREICNTSGATVTDEPVLTTADQPSIQTLLAAGYTDAQQKAVLSESANDYLAWPHTRVHWTFSPFRALNSGKATPDTTYAPLLAQQWRTALGSRGVISNHALNGVLETQLVPIYKTLKQLGAPLTLQTVSPGQIDYNTTIDAGIGYGATDIELWQSTAAGGQAVFPENKLSAWGQALIANAAKAGL